MASSGFDSALNILIPGLLITIVVGFVWVKFMKPYAMPMLKEGWEWIRGQNLSVKKQKTIEYE